MTHHIYHPDTHTDGLCDECPRCQEYVLRPTDLDAENLRRIWRGECHTRTDRLAYNVLYEAAVLSQAIQSAFAWEGHTIDNPPADGRRAIDLFSVGGRR